MKNKTVNFNYNKLPKNLLNEAKDITKIKLYWFFNYSR